MPPTRTAICLVIYTDPGEFEILLQFDKKTHPRNFSTFNGSATCAPRYTSLAFGTSTRLRENLHAIIEAGTSLAIFIHLKSLSTGRAYRESYPISFTFGCPKPEAKIAFDS